MPCKVCGTDRIITEKRVLCPKCEGLHVLDKQEIISNKTEELDVLNSELTTAISNTDYNCSFGSAIHNRELAANAVLYSAPNRRYALNEWLAFTFLAHNLHHTNGTGKEKNYLDLVTQSRRIVDCFNKLSCLKQGLAVLIEFEGKQNFEWTEREPISFVPEEVYKKADSTSSFDKPIYEHIHKDIALLQEGLMQPINVMLLSEEISRLLRQSYHSRILPFINAPANAKSFVQISGILSTEGLDELFRTKAQRNPGLILLDKNGLQSLKKNLCKEFTETQIDWYMISMLKINSDKYGIGSPLILRDEEKDIFCLPLYTLQMLAIANMKWMKESDLGYASNYKGGIVEDYFFRLFNAYEMSSTNPKTGEPFLRIKHPDNTSIEIADIMGYNETYLAVLECKFWNAPTLMALESEIDRFRKRSDFIRDNLRKFDLSENLKVVPLFYTPYAPYTIWNDVNIIPSIFGVGEYLSRLFKSKKPKLLTETESLQILLDNCKDNALPTPVDVAELTDAVQPNTFNIHDGLVWEYDEKEVTLFIDIPISLYGCLVYFDITKPTFKALQEAGVSKGDIIRMVTVNLNGTWAITQLACFNKWVKESEWKSDPNRYFAYRKIISLYLSSPRKKQRNKH